MKSIDSAPQPTQKITFSNMQYFAYRDENPPDMSTITFEFWNEVANRAKHELDESGIELGDAEMLELSMPGFVTALMELSVIDGNKNHKRWKELKYQVYDFSKKLDDYIVQNPSYTVIEFKHTLYSCVNALTIRSTSNNDYDDSIIESELNKFIRGKRFELGTMQFFAEIGFEEIESSYEQRRENDIDRGIDMILIGNLDDNQDDIYLEIDSKSSYGMKEKMPIFLKKLSGNGYEVRIPVEESDFGDTFILHEDLVKERSKLFAIAMFNRNKAKHTRIDDLESYEREIRLDNQIFA